MVAPLDARGAPKLTPLIKIHRQGKSLRSFKKECCFHAAANKHTTSSATWSPDSASSLPSCFGSCRERGPLAYKMLVPSPAASSVLLSMWIGHCPPLGPQQLRCVSPSQKDCSKGDGQNMAPVRRTKAVGLGKGDTAGTGRLKAKQLS